MQDRTFVMGGRVSDFGIDGILQMVSLSRQFTAIELNDDAQDARGVIFLKSGQVVAARIQNKRGHIEEQLEGKSAFIELYLKPSAYFDVFRLESLAKYPNPLGPIPKMLLEAQQSKTKVSNHRKSSSFDVLAPKQSKHTSPPRKHAFNLQIETPFSPSSNGVMGHHHKKPNDASLHPANNESYIEQIKKALQEHGNQEQKQRESQTETLLELLQEVHRTHQKQLTQLQSQMELSLKSIERQLDSQAAKSDAQLVALKEQVTTTANASSPMQIIEMVKLLSNQHNEPQKNTSSGQWIPWVVGFQFILIVAFAVILILRTG